MKHKNEDDIKIVQGSAKDLDISPVYDHIKLDKPIEKKSNKKVIVPKTKKSNK